MTAKTIMLQGTASNVGKSALATALCRIFAEDGYQVAPFKGWNMSLNSYVTKSGGEIGIAQAIQADAANIEPTVEMQPFLLKPEGNGRTQIIKRGSVWTTLSLKQQDSDYRQEVLAEIEDSLTQLCTDYEVVVLEGAGSPAEINIKEEDLANMSVARLKETPVLLVADIDRGGALASVVGTLELLEPEERQLVAGVILNKFRGARELLDSGIEVIEAETGVPVVGVIPYCTDFKVPAEDSVALEDLGAYEAEIEIAVIKLPHISNFTDLEVFINEPQTAVRYVEEAAQLGQPDLIVIPGTKSTVEDLLYLRRVGLEEEILAAAADEVPIIGICGGYQMLGAKIYDPDRIESEWLEIDGLDLLPVETTINPYKFTFQAEAEVANHNFFAADLVGSKLQGYEIHMGSSQLLADAKPLLRIQRRDQEQVSVADGAVSQNGLICGTYLHGLFNNDHLRRELINSLRARKGLEQLDEEIIKHADHLEQSYQQLASIVRDNLDMAAIYELME
ncbi:MAG: cobyric acid synthase [Bacillota bacterium]